jgi:hypothetical protein
VKHFFDLLNGTERPAPTRWAALFLGGIDSLNNQEASAQIPEARLA